MNNNTENVTLLTAFILDVMREVEKEVDDLRECKKIIASVNLQNPYQHIPIEIYNELCAWVEHQLGLEVLIRVGYNIGETAYTALIENAIIEKNASPLATLKGLVIAAESMIEDPENRGWQILEAGEKSILIRRTQTFNSQLQLGVLKGLVEKSGKNKVTVDYAKSVANGDEFDDYLVAWD
ncbi:MAG: hypothetical protein MUE85_16870 [Microscillaceae bacterium]|jgi:hypothetical protein|nr:hypothetical protein [Microscillaceae bacterium]